MNCHSHALRPSARLSLAGTVSSLDYLQSQCIGEVTENPITLALVGARLALRKLGLRFAVD